MIIVNWGGDIKKICEAGLIRCPRCDAIVGAEVWRTAKTAGLYYIKIIKWNKEHWLVCPICQAGAPLNQQQVEEIRADSKRLPPNVVAVEMFSKISERLDAWLGESEKSPPTLSQWLEKTKKDLRGEGHPLDHVEYVLAFWLQEHWDVLGPLLDDGVAESPAQQSVPADGILAYLAVLGVSPEDASRDTIKTAYRRLARQHHPDLCASGSKEDRAAAEKRMVAINQAYDYLSKRPESVDTLRSHAAARHKSQPRKTGAPTKAPHQPSQPSKETKAPHQPSQPSKETKAPQQPSQPSKETKAPQPSAKTDRQKQAQATSGNALWPRRQKKSSPRSAASPDWRESDEVEVARKSPDSSPKGKAACKSPAGSAWDAVLVVLLVAGVILAIAVGLAMQTHDTERGGMVALPSEDRAEQLDKTRAAKETALQLDKARATREAALQLDKARAAIRDKDCDGAAALLARLRSTHEENPEVWIVWKSAFAHAYYTMGMAYGEQKRYAEARRAYDEAARIDPNSEIGKAATGAISTVMKTLRDLLAGTVSSVDNATGLVSIEVLHGSVVNIGDVVDISGKGTFVGHLRIQEVDVQMARGRMVDGSLCPFVGDQVWFRATSK